MLALKTHAHTHASLSRVSEEGTNIRAQPKYTIQTHLYQAGYRLDDWLAVSFEGRLQVYETVLGLTVVPQPPGRGGAAVAPQS